jgi:hypothetical protein
MTLAVSGVVRAYPILVQNCWSSLIVILVSCSQVVFYYSTKSRDSLLIKTMVFVVWVSDTLHQAFVFQQCTYVLAHSCWDRLLRDYRRPRCVHHRADDSHPPPLENFRVRKDQLHHPQAGIAHRQLELCHGSNDGFQCYSGTSVRSSLEPK